MARVTAAFVTVMRYYIEDERIGGHVKAFSFFVTHDEVGHSEEEKIAHPVPLILHKKPDSYR